MYAEIVVNIESPLESTFHYHVPLDLQRQVRVGHLVEVEFGKRMVQGIVIGFVDEPEVDNTKPIISLIDHIPVVRQWQIELAQWLSDKYQAALNQCLRLMLPPGLTRWSDVTVAINPYWNGEGRLTDVQDEILRLLRERGDLRGRQLQRLMPKGWRKKTQTAIRQLVNREILQRGTVLEPPKARPKKITTAELAMDPERVRDEVVQLGRKSYAAEVLNYLVNSADPLPLEKTVLGKTGASEKHLAQLEIDGLVERVPEKTVQVPGPDGELVDYVEEASVGLGIRPKQTLRHILALRGAQKYYDILSYLADAAQPVTLTELYAATDSSRTQLNKLEKLDLIRYGAEHVWRNSLADRDFVPTDAPPLTEDQAVVWRKVEASMDVGRQGRDSEQLSVNSEQSEEGTASRSTQHAASISPFLLHGVTGSGKTEIYMRAIEKALARGQQAIVLVPEIALTPQTVRRFAARFPGRVAMMHSRLSAGERYDTWRRARLGMFDIVVGPRSALFTPLENIGVIVLDEEHDGSYKQGPPVPPPYYHARDAAIALGTITGATVILGSATPDLVTYHAARAGEMTLLEMPKRVMGHRSRIEQQAARIGRENQYAPLDSAESDAMTIDLPPITIVDLRHELRAGNRSVFSRVLQSEMDAVLERKEQAILFLNRRGANTHVFCRDCGHVMECPNCDTPLTYHKFGQLTCHHCGYREQQPDRCPNCGSRKIKYFGLGTEQLEELVQRRWPEARTVRWDRDTTQGKDSHEEILARFVNQGADILIGTQMIAKGLDLPLVTLVGVVSADVSLNLPDFRTSERAFQLLTQVAGRAGRSLLGGRVVIQTYQPEHYAIQAASEHDYVQFYLEEIRFRTQHRYPPFSELVKFVVSDLNPNRALDEAKRVATELRLRVRDLRLGATEVIGPVPPFFGRIDRRFRQQIVVRTSDPSQLLEDFHLPPPWVVDIDPESLL